jgi:FkbM family methyltransferase
MNLTQRRIALMRSRGINLVFDVGANTGQFGGFLRSLGYRGRIVSFEPVSQAFSSLQKTTAGDPTWSAHNLALGAADEVATINISANSEASSFLRFTEETLRIDPSLKYIGSQQVTVRRLDSLLATLARPEEAIYLKIDAQGYEAKILQGASRVIARFALIQLEVSFFKVYQEEMPIIDALRLMESLGFHVVGMEPGWEDPKTGEMLQADFIFGRK